MPTPFDAIVIGTGQAGPPLARRLTEEGLKTAVVERQHFGGTCVNVGCIPTKALVASAHAAHLARRAGDFGIAIDAPVRVDMKAVIERKNSIVARSRQGVQRSMERLALGTVYRGHARFEGPKTVRIGGDLITAERIFINTGARAAIPHIPGLDQVGYLTNSTLMALDVLPAHLLILGGSYIGLEFAQMYRRFGSRVTVVEAGERLIAREDADVSQAVRQILEKEGIEMHLNAQRVAVEKNPAGIAMSFDAGGRAQNVVASHLLVAVGRQPNSDDLGVDAAGIRTDERGYITVDEQLETSVPGVWAMGDVNGRGAFTHTSYNDFEIVAANLFDKDSRRVGDRIACYGLFIDPPLGRVGKNDREVHEAGVQVLTAKLAMTSVGRARLIGETDGFMKVTVEAASKRILGAAILGAHGDEVVQSFLGVMAAGAPYTVIARGMYIHPTVAEYLPTLFEDLKPVPR